MGREISLLIMQYNLFKQGIVLLDSLYLETVWMMGEEGSFWCTVSYFFLELIYGITFIYMENIMILKNRFKHDPIKKEIINFYVTKKIANKTCSIFSTSPL